MADIFNPNNPHNLQHLPPNVNFDDIRILKALIKAQSAIGELRGRSMALPNPMHLMSAAITKESVESSQIEGINTTVESVLEGQAVPESKLTSENKETLRYKEAMFWGFRNLSNYSISTRLIQGIQQTLLENSLGSYRVQQNSIENQLTKEKIYTPPIASQINELMNNWEKFSNNHDDNLDPFIKIAICHYQFEAIHPFSDGNGRTGRILMVLQMVETGLLKHPVLYISGYLNKNRSKYYELLRNVTANGAWIEYIEFMIEGFASQATKTKEKLVQMEELYQSIKQTIRDKNPKYRAQDITDHLFFYVVTSPSQLSKSMDVNYQTASKYLQKLKDDGILESKWIGKQHLFACTDLLKMII